MLYLLLGLVSIILPMFCTDPGTSPWGCDNDDTEGLTVLFLALVVIGVLYIVGHMRDEDGAAPENPTPPASA